MSNFFLNLITFGAAERVEDAQFEYEEACDRYNRKVKKSYNLNRSCPPYFVNL